MTTGRIQLRRSPQGVAVDESDNAVELWYIGELCYDDQKIRIGVFSNEDAKTIRWLQGFSTNQMFFDQGLQITGLDTLGNVNDIVLDWDTPGVLQIRAKQSGQVIVSISTNGVSFTQHNMNVATLSSGANRMINGDISILRKVGHEDTFSTMDAQYHWMAPNWLVWRDSGSSSIIQATFDTSDVLTSDVRLPRIITVHGSNNPENCGLRSFIYDYPEFAGSTIHVAIRIKGQESSTNKIRILSENSGSPLITSNITGTGEWETHVIPVYLPADGSSWLAIDSLYEPGFESTGVTVWKVGGLQFGSGPQPGVFERRSLAVETQLVETIYQEGRVFIPDDTTIKSVSLRPMQAAPNQVFLVNPQDGTEAYTNLDATGFEVSVPSLTAVNGTVIKYAATILPATP